MGVSGGPDIVEDGLVLYLDAANKRSYSGTGTTWNDLTSNTNGTLINSPTFNTGNLGLFSLNGVNQNIDLGTFTRTTFSFNLIIKPNAVQQIYANIIDNNHTNFRGFVLQQDVGSTNSYSLGMANVGGYGPIFLEPSRWHYLTCTYIIGGLLKYYKDGNFITSFGPGGGTPIFDSSFLRIGSWGGGGRNWNGEVALFSVYNRALTDQEVSQNFNALRGRYGI